MYNTKQRNEIINVLKNNEENSMSAKEIIELLSDVSLATLYRNLETLTNENIIRKYFNEVSNVYEYQYIESLDECSHHLHLKCKVCGKLYHLHCKLSDPLVNHINKEHDFVIDFNQSIIYGTCKKCLLIRR